jgi:4-amino-4-deoxy-L-arabinose transferase-like glycosyltransferase
LSILLLALVLRILHLISMQSDPVSRYPLLDEEYYLDAAVDLARGQDLPRPYWRPPGMHYFLAPLVAIFGPTLLAARVLQILLSAAACGLTFWLGSRLFSPAIGVAGALLLAVHGVAIDFSLAVKAVTWVAFLDLLALCLLVSPAGPRSIWKTAGAGAALGVSALFRPVILVFVPLAAIWLARWSAHPRRRGMMLAFLIGTALPVAPVAILNTVAAGRPVLVSTNGGMNFFIGNNAGYESTVTARPGNQWQDRIIRPAQEDGFGQAGPARDRYYYSRGLEYLGDHPVEGAIRFLRKTYLFLNGHEIPRDTDIYVRREASGVLRLLTARDPVPMPNGLLIPFALLGAAVLWRRRREAGPVYLFLGSQVLVGAAYFAASRYRTPLVPVVCLFAAAGAGFLAHAFAHKRHLRAGSATAAVAVLLVVLNLETFETRQTLRSEYAYFLGNAWIREGRPERALEAYRTAVAADSTDSRPWQGIEKLLRQDEDWRGALQAQRKVVEIGPYFPGDWDLFYDLHLRAGDVQGAYDVLREDLALTQQDTDRQAVLNGRLGELFYRSGDYDHALDVLRRALRLNPRVSQGIAAWLATVRVAEEGRDPDMGRGEFWLHLGRELHEPDRGTAREALHHAAACLPESALVREDVARWLERLGDAAGAEKVRSGG